ncbi:MAG: hypothetical protein RR057_05650 [Clostridia bacterium]
MKFKISRFFAIFLAIALSFSCSNVLIFAAENDNDSKFLITFDEGFDLINPLTGKKPTQVFTGTVPKDISVVQSERFIFPENTIKFRDYIFSAWKYTYTDENGKKVTNLYQPGDTFNNVTSNMKIRATWKRPDPISLSINGYINYVNNDELVDGEPPKPEMVFFGSTIKLKKCEMTKDGYYFLGWSDSDGVLYNDGAEYYVNKYNPILTAEWIKDGDAVATHQIKYLSGSADATGTPPPNTIIYKKNTFKALDCHFVRDGYNFLYWQDAQNNKYYSGKNYDVPADEQIVLTATWEKASQYYSVVVNTNEFGTADPSTKLTIPKGANTTVHLSPFEGYFVKEVTLNGEKIDDFETFYIENITKNMTFNVIFAPNTYYKVAYKSTEGGKIIVSDMLDKYLEGYDLQFKIETEKGYVLEKINIEGGTYNLEDGIYTVPDIKNDIEIEAIFKKDAGTIDDESMLPIPSTDDSQPHSSDNNGIIYVAVLGTIVLIMIVGAIIFYKKRIY